MTKVKMTKIYSGKKQDEAVTDASCLLPHAAVAMPVSVSHLTARP